MKERKKQLSLNAYSLDFSDPLSLIDHNALKSVMRIANGSGAGPRGLETQLPKDLVCKSYGSAGYWFLRSFSKLVNLIADNKVHETVKFFFSRAKPIELNKIDNVQAQQ